MTTASRAIPNCRSRTGTKNKGCGSSDLLDPLSAAPAGDLGPYLQVCLAIPVLKVPECAVPTAQCRPQLLGNCRDLGAAYNRDHHTVFHYHIVHRNKERRPLDRIKFTFGCMKEVVVRIVAPARSITTLPFVFLGRYFR